MKILVCYEISDKRRPGNMLATGHSFEEVSGLNQTELERVRTAITEYSAGEWCRTHRQHRSTVEPNLVFRSVTVLDEGL
jgi:hypothetical protein